MATFSAIGTFLIAETIVLIAFSGSGPIKEANEGLTAKVSQLRSSFFSPSFPAWIEGNFQM
jgi:hypothetical protein